MDSNKQMFLEAVDKDAQWHWRKQRQLRVLKGAATVAIAIAGVLTTSAGISGTQSGWYATHSALTAWGLITAVGAALDQLAGPGKRAEHHLQLKIALRAIEAAVRYQNLPVAK